MAFDLDEEELLATRKLNGVDKESNIDEYIKILQGLTQDIQINFKGSIENRIKKNEVQALEYILSDYTRQKQINEEHQKNNGELREKIKELEKEKEQYEQMYLDEVDKTTDVVLLYNGLLNKIKNELKIAKKENYINETYNKESRNYWINQGKINLSKKLLEDK